MRGSYVRDGLLLAVAFVLLLVGLATPAFFRAVSPEALKSLGEDSPGLYEEADKLVGNSKVGAYEMLKRLDIPKSDELDKRMDNILSNGEIDQTIGSLAGTASAFDIANFETYFKGLDPFNQAKGRNTAFFVFNHAYRQGHFDKELESKGTENVTQILKSVPRDDRPGAFIVDLLNDPLVLNNSGVKIIEIQHTRIHKYKEGGKSVEEKVRDFPSFVGRRIALSVAKLPITGDGQKDLDTITAACRSKARQQLEREGLEIERFVLSKIQKNSDDNQTEITLTPQNATVSSTLTGSALREVASNFQELTVGSIDKDAYRVVVIGGILGPEGKVELHGRWMPFPMLKPTMLGTAMFVQMSKLDGGDDPGRELGTLSTKMLQGDLYSKERLRVAYWSLYQLASRLNWGQMAEVLGSCSNLQAIDDLATLVRLAHGRTSELASKLKQLKSDSSESAQSERISLERLLKEARNDSEIDVATVYAASLLCDDPSAVLHYIRSYPASGEEKEARALADLRFAIAQGKESLNYLLELGLPVYEPGVAMSTLSGLFPVVGGDGLVRLSHSYRKTAFFLKGLAFATSFMLVTMALAGILPEANYRHGLKARKSLRFCRNLTCGAFGSLLVFLCLEPALLQPSFEAHSRAGFNFSLANLIPMGSSQDMTEDNLTLVTALVAGGFLLMQIIIYVFCLMRISEVRKQSGEPGLKLELLDNEDNLFDLGLYVGLGGTVLSLVLLLILDVKQDALIGAYASTLFGIIFVAILKIFHVRPYRNQLLVARAKESKI